MNKKGEFGSQMQFAPGLKYSGTYSTPFGSLNINVITDYIAKKKFDTKAINAAKTNLETISSMFTVINEMFTTLREMKVPKLLFIKFIFLKLAMMQIITTCTMISSLAVLLPIIQLGVLLVKTVSVFFEHIKTVFDTISKIKITPITFLKLVMINLAMPIMIPIMASSIGIGVLALAANAFVFQIIVFFGQINALFTSIKKTPVGPLMIPKLLMMLMVLLFSIEKWVTLLKSSRAR